MLEPESSISMIVDAMTKYKTGSPTFSRQTNIPGFRALEQQLYGVLVHADRNNEEYKGGFFGYLVDESVIQGTNVNVECVHRTLLKLKKQRKKWPETLYVQLDNTSKDNKNRGTFGYFAYLVAAGVFKKVVVSFLPVGHTHEDIDAVASYHRRSPRCHLGRVSNVHRRVRAEPEQLDASFSSGAHEGYTRLERLVEEGFSRIAEDRAGCD
jgi:hypothetical protein